MRTRPTRKGKTTKRKSRFGGMGGESGTREDLYNRAGHYLGVVQRIESGERASDDKPFIAIRATVVKAYDDGERFVPPGAAEAQAHHAPGDTPGNLLMEDKFGFLPNWKNFMQVAGDVTDADAEGIAERLFAAVQADGELPEELAQYAEYADGIESFDDALDAVWDLSSKEVYGEDQPLAGTVVEWVSNMRKKKDARGKTEEQLSPSDFYTRTVYRRRLSYADALAEVGKDDAALRRVLPDIDDRVVAEAAEE